MRNHTGTHLLNWALRDVLGDEVQQKGSLVDAEKTRFDFSYQQPVGAAEIALIEARVGEQIGANHPVFTQEIPQADARRIETLRAVFGEKYPDVVRVVSIGADIAAMLETPQDPRWMQYAVEFCGGTHLTSTAAVGPFVLVGEEGVAKGVRRVVGVTGATAEQAVRQADSLENQLAALEQTTGDELASGVATAQREVEAAAIALTRKQALRERLAALLARVKAAEKVQSAAAGDAVRSRVRELVEQADTVEGVLVVAGEVPAAKADALRAAVDWVRSKSEASAVLLACADGGKVTLLAGMSKAVVARGIKAGDLIREIAPLVGGKGGGRPDMAQGGGNDPAKIGDAVRAAGRWIRARL
jgi:alanyl-tRNA synthetase